MEEGGIAFDALERFCSSHEQTYAEFLESFMHLRKEDLKKQKTSSPDGDSIADDEYKLTQRVLLENSVQIEGELPKDGKKVEHYIDIEKRDNKKQTEYQSNSGLEVLPGEIVEETAANYTHYESKHTSLNFKVNPNVEEYNENSYDQVLTDEVQPFTLDEDFDYDYVCLKPKYTETEIKTISALSKQRLERENLM